VVEPVPDREVPAPQRAVEVIELSELFLPLAVGRPEFEARRLAMKARVPFRLADAPSPAGAGP